MYLSFVFAATGFRHGGIMRYSVMNGWKLYIYGKFFFPQTQTLRKKECEENRMYCTPESLLHGTYSTAGTPDILGLHDFSRSVGYGKRDKLGQKHEYFQSDFTRFGSSFSYIGSSLQPSAPASSRGICPMPENFTPKKRRAQRRYSPRRTCITIPVST